MTLDELRAQYNSEDPNFEKALEQWYAAQNGANWGSTGILPTDSGKFFAQPGDSYSAPVTINGQQYMRVGEGPENSSAASWLQPIIASNPGAFISDPTYGSLLRMDVYKQLSDAAAQHNQSNEDFFDKGGGVALVGAGFLGPALAAGGMGAGGLAGAEAAGGAMDMGVGLGMDGGTWGFSGPTALGGEGSLASLADAPWGVNPQTSPAFLNAQDPIQAINALDEIGGLQGATAGANALGFDSVQAALGSINPSWVSAGLSGGSLLSKLMSGGSTADWLKAAGNLGASALGYLGAKDQANSLEGVSDKFLSLGAPARARLESTYKPGFSLMNEPGFKNAMDVSSESVLRKLSAGVGNPYDNPGAVNEARKYVMGSVALPQLNTLRSQLATQAGLGVNTAGTASMGSAQAGSGTYDALGYGLSQFTNPTSSLEELLKKIQGGNKLNYGTAF